MSMYRLKQLLFGLILVLPIMASGSERAPKYDFGGGGVAPAAEARMQKDANGRPADRQARINSAATAVDAPIGSSFSGSVAQFESNWYRITDASFAASVTASLTNLASDVDLFVYQDPSASWLCSSTYGGTSDEECVIPGGAELFVEVYGYTGGPYVLDIAGDSAGSTLVPINLGEQFTNSVARGEVIAYSLTADDPAGFQAALTNNSGDPDLYIYSAADYNANDPMSSPQLCSSTAWDATDELCSLTDEQGEFVIGVYGYQASTYTISIEGLGGGRVIPGPTGLNLTVSSVDVADCPEHSLFFDLTDSSGLVPTIDLSNLILTENGQENTDLIELINLDSVGSTTAVNLAILLDYSGSMGNAVGQLNDAASDFIAAMRPGTDSVNVVSFASDVSTIYPLGQDLDAAMSSLASAQTRGSGSTAMYDAISFSAADLSSLAGYSAIVLFTDGDDTASATSVDDAINEATASSIPVYTIAAGSANGPVLARIADETGGQYYGNVDLADIGDIYSQINETISNLYQLVYMTNAALDGSDVDVELMIDLGGSSSNGSRVVDSAMYTACATPNGGGMITIDSPLGGNVWYLGNVEQTRWTTDSGISRVMVELYKADTFLTSMSTPPNGTVNDGNFAWPVPTDSLTGDDFQVKVSDVSNPDAYVLSDYFEIQQPNLVGCLPGVVPSSDNVQAAQTAYVSYYGRPADPTGQEYWACRIANEGGDLFAVIDEFGNSAEYQDLAQSLGSTTDYFGYMYQTLFNRVPDAGGLTFWENQLNTGSQTLQSVALSLYYGAVNTDALIVYNKVEAAQHCTEVLETNGLDYVSDVEGIRRILSSVDETASSLSTARSQFDRACSGTGGR